MYAVVGLVDTFLKNIIKNKHKSTPRYDNNKRMSHIDFRVVFYNIMIPVLPPFVNHGQHERSTAILDAIEKLYLPTIDVIVINEAIPRKIAQSVLTAFATVGFRYHTSALSDKLSLVDGGVIIVSKHKITQEDRELFKEECSGTDCLAAKGVSYARVKKEGNYFNIFATHQQAWPSLESQVIRINQTKKIKNFMDSIEIPTNEPVILAGDLNIDRYKDSEQFRYFLNLLNLDMPEISKNSERFTIDPTKNQLVGADAPDMYSNEQWPDGCAEEYFQTLKCPCCPSEWIDFILYSNKHLRPISSDITSVNVKVEPMNINLHGHKNISIRDPSDHFPVTSSFRFPEFESVKGDELYIDENRGGPVFDHRLFIAIVIGVVIIVLTVVGVSFFLMKNPKSWAASTYAKTPIKT
jgi:exonuclease III